METLPDLWGLSFNQTILSVAVLLVAMDFFLPTDVPTHIAYILVCALVAITIHAHILIKILSRLLAWFGFVVFHYRF